MFNFTTVVFEGTSSAFYFTNTLGWNTSSSIEMTNGIHTHTPEPVYEQEYITVWWNQAVHTDREVTAKRPDIIN